MRGLRPVLLLSALLLATPLRAETLALDTEAGSERLLQAGVGPQGFGLMAHLETEMYLTFCGPAALATALNSLGIRDPSPPEFYPYHRVTQASVFTPKNLAVKSLAQVQGAGMTLEQLLDFAHNLGAEAKALHGDVLTEADLRGLLQRAQADSRQRVIANYSRRAIGQEGEGHFSPIGAFDAASDSVLILDVARYKYPPVWVPVPELLQAMQTVDTDAGKARGLLLLTVP
ncbi:phytochelatin synthase family protein [Paracraurococcus lichenis]|uniref:glutathione gamma-glutamylcysteinyltransferase n=1 Tax=Paracraurococcus lichenis TaxID=3064888 RepID=A0ABT9DWX2_9PROT|nr:phytochelatin synthase family protein [Paracraurococcus sp. LOR1-02]MDO9708401.1 phytochelatin synthase family protein [Paracraurococcus sp. LOR1-02]